MIFPEKTIEDKKMYKEYAWDFEKDEVIFENGLPLVVTGKKAIKVWVYKVLKTHRYRFLVYSFDYGISLDQYISKTKTIEVEMAMKNDIEKALLKNQYIKGIQNLKMQQTNSSVQIAFQVQTDFGEVKIEWKM